jgi:thiamine-phosphate diphosphorylase
MTLPPLLVLTDRGQCEAPLLDTLAAVVAAGARAIVLREKDLPPSRRAELAEATEAILAPVGGLLIVAGTGMPAAAVHLAAADALPIPRPALLGRSCHNREEVQAARADGCDYITLSPVFPSPSKPGYGPPLRTTGLADLVPDGPPAYALGGICPADVPACLSAGARGVAVMGAVMRDPDLVAAYLAALTPVEAGS